VARVASCAYEAGTAWGTGVGFMYQSVVEDYFTGYQRFFFSRGWTSAYCYPEHRPAFLGSVPTNLNDVLVQNKRWMSGMLAVGVSRRHSPLLRASLLQAMAYAYFGFVAAAFASSLLQHLEEVCVAKRRIALRTWWKEQRFWVLNALTGQLFGCVSAAQELLGARALDFDLTSKAADGRLYQDGVFDFTGCSTLLLPATTLSVRGHRRQHLEDDVVRRLPIRRRAAVPRLLPAAGGDVPPVGCCQGSATHHRTLGRLGSRAARRVWMSMSVYL
jgi:hypothetical protein